MWILILVSSLIYLLTQFWLTIFICQIKILPSTSKENLAPLSVIIAARNAEPYIRKYLPSVLRQSYPLFEVIVVLDRCTDGSLTLIKQYQEEYPQLFLLEIDETPDGWASKKWALTQAIANAQYDYLVFIDADCQAENNWLQTVGTHFSNGAEVILGLGLYEKHPALLNAFIRFETFYAAFQYIALAAIKKPYMAVGRNLAYKRSFFEKYEGFEKFKSRISGDDDLFINAFGKNARIAPMIEQGSRTFSEPKHKLKNWIKQKRRHLSAASNYSLESRVFLGIFHISHMIFYLGLFLALFAGSTISLIFTLYIGRILSSWCLFLWANKKLQFRQLLFLFPVLDLLFFIYNLTVVPIGLITNKPEWI